MTKSRGLGFWSEEGRGPNRSSCAVVQFGQKPHEASVRASDALLQGSPCAVHVFASASDQRSRYPCNSTTHPLDIGHIVAKKLLYSCSNSLGSPSAFSKASFKDSSCLKTPQCQTRNGWRQLLGRSPTWSKQQDLASQVGPCLPSTALYILQAATAVVPRRRQGSAGIGFQEPSAAGS